MKSFSFIESNDRLYIKFPFDKTWTITKVVLIVLFFTSTLFFVKWQSIDYVEFFVGFFVCSGLFIYMSLNSYLEWRKYGRKLLEKKDGKLYVDHKLITDLHQIKFIIVDYEGTETSVGWLVEFEFYLCNTEVYIKTQLSEKIAHDLADRVSTFFSVEVKKLG